MYKIISSFISVLFLSSIVFSQQKLVPQDKEEDKIIYKKSSPISPTNAVLGAKTSKPTFKKQVIDPFSTNSIERCSQSEKHHQLMEESQAYSEGVAATEQSIQEQLSSIPAKTGGTYDIPVVFHVIHEGEAYGERTNITDEQIQSSLDALNRDFTASADDGGVAQSTVPAAQGDTEIRFCLAQRDPNGNPHSGINRVDGTVVAGFAADGITNANEVDVKNLSRWDNRYYLNVWVVTQIDGNGANTADHTSWGGGVLGYAYFPTNPVTNNAARDGIVQISICTGNDPDGSAGHRLWPPTVLNRTLTHEVGHYLNLYHTFEGNSCTEGDCATEGDRCCDTPPTTQQTNCNTPACGGTQQVENYLDYTGDACYEMFSVDQTNRMTAVLTGTRNALVNTSNCISPLDWDVEIASIINPLDETCGQEINPIVTLRNNGANTVTSVDIQYDINGGGTQTYAWTGTLESSQSVSVTLPQITSPTGTNTFNATTVSGTINGTNTDDETTNDAASSTFTISSGTSVELVLITDDYGHETAWQLVDGATTVIYEGGNLSVIPGGSREAEPSDAGAYANNTTITYNWCLADGCYDFNIYDDWGDGICCGEGNGSYTLTNINEGATIATGGNFEVSTTENFCITTEEGPPTANFEASSTTVFDGGSVNLTDLSTGNPSPDTWTWSVTGPGTVIIDDLNAQNTSVQFDGIGLYTVELTVSNTEGSDTETKVDYIEVVEDNSDGECTLLSNIFEDDELTVYATNEGYASGQNEFNMDAYAEPFNTDIETQVRGIRIAVRRAYDASGSTTINFNVYDDDNGDPGTILGSQVVELADLEEDFYNTVTFDGPVTVNGDFWVGFEFDQNSSDTLALYTAVDREPNTTFIRYNGSWNDFNSVYNSIYGADISTSMGLDVFLSNGPAVASFTQEEVEICTGESIVFDASSSEKATEYEWTITGANPESSNEIIDTFTFPNTGIYDVELLVQGGCFSDIATSSVTVNEVPDVGAGTNQFVCEGESVTLTASNPDGATISWDNGVVNGEAFTPALGSVIYTVTADLDGCRNSDDVLVEVNSIPTASLTGTDIVCENATEPQVTFMGDNGTPPYTFSYTLNGGATQTITSDGTGFATINVSTATVGVYEYELISVTDNSSSECSQAQTGSATITVNQGVSYSLSGTDPSECNLADGYIEISGLEASTEYGVSYDGNAIENITSDGAGVLTITDLSAGSYTDFIVTLDGCTTEDNTVITLNNPGAPTVGAGADQTVCEGTSVTLIAENPDEADISWENGVVDGEAFTPPIGTTTYTVTAELDGCSSSDNVNVTVSPEITINPINDIEDCGSISLPTITGDNLTGGEMFYTESNGAGQSFANNAVISYEDFDNYPVTLYAYDGSGDCSDEVSFNIVITNTTVALSCPPTINISCDISEAPAYETYTEFINAGGSVSGGEVIEGSFMLGSEVSNPETCPKTVTRTYLIEGECGNTSTCEQAILINDEEAPVIECSIEQDSILLSEGNETPDYLSSVTASDNCSNNLIITQVPEAGSELEVGENIVTITAEDDCGNTSSCEITVQLDDDLNLTENEKNGVLIYPNPTDGDLQIELNGFEGANTFILLYDVNGKVLIEKEIGHDTETTLNLSSFAKGVYHISIRSDKTVINKKITKM